MQQEAADTARAGAEEQTAHLCVPPEARYARVVRLTAANLASIAGLTVDEVDDVRMAAEEAFVYACATEPEGDLRVDFTLAPGSVRMTFHLGGAAVSEDASEPALVYSALILDAMCDECRIDDEPHAMHLLKRTGTVSPMSVPYVLA